MNASALLKTRSGQTELDLVQSALAISRIPYGRPRELSARGVLEEWRGTCSTKHLLLRDLVNEVWPELAPVLWHRVYTVTRAFAAQRWSTVVAERVPPEGLVDVHTYATLLVDTRRITVDVTFPIDNWDGKAALPLACGKGVDYEAGADPLGSKAKLVAAFCRPAAREQFITALSAI